MIGTSFSYLTYVSKTNNSTVIKAGTLALTFKNESSGIYLNNALPQSDEEGLANEKEYSFEIENTGTIASTYKLTLDNTCTLDKSYSIEGVSLKPDKCIPNEYIKVAIKEGDSSSYQVIEKKKKDLTKGEGQVNGAVQTEEGMNFDGADDYIDMGNTNYDFGNKLTVAVRFKTSSFKTGGTVLIDNYSYSNGKATGFELFVAGNGRIVLQFFSSDDNSRKQTYTSSATELDKWYVVVATYDGSNVKIYLNGKLEKTVVLSPDEINAINTINPLYIGANPHNGPHFVYNGTISDALVINDVLTEEEIQTNYSSSFSYQENEKTVFYQNWDGDESYVLDVGSINSGEVKTYKMKVWLDYNTPNTYNSKGELNVIYSGKLGLSYEQGVKNLDKSGANPPVLSSNMVPVYYDETGEVWRKADSSNNSKEYQWYDYDDRMWANSVTYDHTLVYDESNNGNSGDINEAIYTKEGMRFDGIDDYVDGGNANYDFGNKLTVAARFKTSSFKTGGTVLIDNYTSKTGFEFFVGQTNGRICFQFYSLEDSAIKRVCSSATELNKWYTAVATYDGSNMKMYLDGKLVGTVAMSETLTSSTKNFVVGAAPYYIGSGNNRFFYDGTISDALVINDVLTEEEIAQNYSNVFNYQENKKTLFYYNLRGYEGRENGSEVPMDMINNMLVWIPRYKYEVWNYNEGGISTSSSPMQSTNIKFEEGTSSTGEIICTDNIQGENGDGTSETCKLKFTNEICTDSLCNGKTYTHPGFTFGDKQLKGIWVGKFEASAEKNSDCYINPSIDNCNKSVKLLTKPDVISYRYASVSIQEENIMAINDEGNVYGFSNTEDTHMIKNMEWGAVTYLQRSKYGTVIAGIKNYPYKNNSSNFYTGRCGSILFDDAVEEGTYHYNDIENGTKASTTYNIYGVYDMEGGAWERTMANIISPDGSTMMSGYGTTSNSGYTGIVYASGAYSLVVGKSYPNDKYIDKYSFGTTNLDSDALLRGKLGDGIKETTSNQMLYNVKPWPLRGGVYSTTNKYINYLGVSTGYPYVSYSTRIVVTS